MKKKKVAVEAVGSSYLERFPSRQNTLLDGNRLRVQHVISHYAYPDDGTGLQPYRWHYSVALFFHHKVYDYEKMNFAVNKITIAILEESYEFD